MYATFGLLVALNGALVPQIRADLGLSLAQMGLILGAWQFVYILTSIPAGRVADLIGPRRAIAAAAIIMLGSAALRTTATGFWGLLLPVAAFGLGAPIISISAPKVTASLFVDAERRKAVGIYGTAPAIGGVAALVVGPVLVGPLVDDDWRAITLVLVGLASVSLAVWFLASRGLDEIIEPGTGPDLRAYVSLAQTPVVAFVLLLAALNFFAAHGVGQWMVGMLTSTGWSAGAASLWTAAGTLVGLVATLLLPRMATVERRPLVLATMLTSGAVGLTFLLSENVALLAIAIALTAVQRSAVMPTLSMILMDAPNVGPEKMGAASGLYFAIAQIGGVAGPATTGALSDATGGFGVPLALHGGVLVSMSVGVLVLLPRLSSGG